MCHLECSQWMGLIFVRFLECKYKFGPWPNSKDSLTLGSMMASSIRKFYIFFFIGNLVICCQYYVDTSIMIFWYSYDIQAMYKKNATL